MLSLENFSKAITDNQRNNKSEIGLHQEIAFSGKSIQILKV